MLTAYSKIIDTQMHFNEMGMRIRSFAITLILAVLGAAAYSMQTKVRISGLHISAMILFVALIGWFAFYLLDAFHYHKLLRGAVQFGMTVEDAFKSDEMIGSVMGMTNAITAESRKMFGRANLFGTQVKGISRIHLFYMLVLFILLVLLLLAWKYNPVDSDATTGSAQRIELDVPDGIDVHFQRDPTPSTPE